MLLASSGKGAAPAFGTFVVCKVEGGVVRLTPDELKQKLADRRWILEDREPSQDEGQAGDWWFDWSTGNCYERTQGQWHFRGLLEGRIGTYRPAAPGILWHASPEEPAELVEEGDYWLRIPDGDIYIRRNGRWEWWYNVFGIREISSAQTRPPVYTATSRLSPGGSESGADFLGGIPASDYAVKARDEIVLGSWRFDSLTRFESMAYGGFVPSGRYATGYSHNLLFAADQRFTVTETGSVQAGEGIGRLFNEQHDEIILGRGWSPWSVEISGLPLVAISDHGWIFWAAASGGPRDFAIAVYDAVQGRWETIASERGWRYPFYAVKIKGPRTISRLRLTVTAGQNGDGTLHLSQLGFIHPQAAPRLSGTAGDLLVGGRLGVGTYQAEYELDLKGSLRFTGNLFQQAPDTGETYLRSSDYVSRLTGWSISSKGNAEFRSVYADELIARSVTSDVSQALVGSEIITKSRATLAASFLVPPEGQQGTLIVEDIDGIPGLPAFSVGDTLRLRVVDRTSGILVLDVWARVEEDVTDSVNPGDGLQAWTVTILDRGRLGPDQYVTGVRGSGSGSPYTGHLTVQKGTTVLDYGRPGDAVIYTTVLDSASPYMRMFTWHDQDGDGVPDSYTLLVQLGDLSGITYDGSVLSGHGLFGENVYLTGSIRQTDGKWALLNDGSGHLADGRISWDASGNLTITGATLSAVSGIQNFADYPSFLKGPSQNGGQAGLYASGEGFGYYDGAEWSTLISQDGSGHLAGGAIAWDAFGNLTVDKRAVIKGRLHVGDRPILRFVARASKTGSSWISVDGDDLATVTVGQGLHVVVLASDGRVRHNVFYDNTQSADLAGALQGAIALSDGGTLEANDAVIIVSRSTWRLTSSLRIALESIGADLGTYSAGSDINEPLALVGQKGIGTGQGLQALAPVGSAQTDVEVFGYYHEGRITGSSSGGGSAISGRALIDGSITAEKLYVGDLSALNATIGGWQLSEDRIFAENIRLFSGTDARIEVGTGLNTAGLITASNNTDVVFWAGSDYAGRSNAPFRVTLGGDVYAESVTLVGPVIQQATITTTGDLTPGVDRGSDLGTTTKRWGEIRAGYGVFTNDAVVIGSQSRRISGSGLELYGTTSSAILSTQDGNGQIQLKWNATRGTNETYLVSGEPAARWEFDPSSEGSELFAIYRGAAGMAGAAIPWETILQVGTSTFAYKGNTIWHAGNDGAGSGLDADKLDGYDATAFPRKAEAATITESWTFQKAVLVDAPDHGIVIRNTNDPNIELWLGQFGSSATQMRIVPFASGNGLWNNDLYFDYAGNYWGIDGTVYLEDELGIGTTSPAYTLDVAGSGRFTQTLLADRVLPASYGAWYWSTARKTSWSVTTSNMLAFRAPILVEISADSGSTWTDITSSYEWRRLTSEITSTYDTGVKSSDGSLVERRIRFTYDLGYDTWGAYIFKVCTQHASNVGVKIEWSGDSASWGAVVDTGIIPGMWDGVVEVPLNKGGGNRYVRITITLQSTNTVHTLKLRNFGLYFAGSIGDTLETNWVHGWDESRNIQLRSDGTISTPAVSWESDVDTGIYHPTSDTLGLVTAGAERLRITSTGSVGIGTTAPAYTLDVAGNGRFAADLTVDGSLTATGHFWFLAADLKMRRYADGDTVWKRALVSWSDMLDINYGSDFQKVRLQGYVGIRVIPSYPFHVSGNALFENDVLFSGAISSEVFQSGFFGSGWRITSTGEATFDSLTVRGTLRVYELLLEQLRATNGNVVVSDAARLKVQSVSGSTVTLVAVEDDSDRYIPFAAGDLVLAQRFRWNTSSQSYDVIVRIKGTVTSVNNTTQPYSCTITLTADSTAVSVGEEYDFVRVGSSDTARQGVIYLAASDQGAPFVDIIDGIASWGDWSSTQKVKARLGKLGGVIDSAFGGMLDDYGLYSDNTYLKGKLVIAPSGDGVTTPPAGSGLYMDGKRMGYYSGGAWKAYIQNDGKFRFEGDASQYIAWDGTTLSVLGTVKHSGGTWELNKDGSGHLAGGAIDWTSSGTLIISRYSAGSGAGVATVYHGRWGHTDGSTSLNKWIKLAAFTTGGVAYKGWRMQAFIGTRSANGNYTPQELFVDVSTDQNGRPYSGAYYATLTNQYNGTGLLSQVKVVETTTNTYEVWGKVGMQWGVDCPVTIRVWTNATTLEVTTDLYNGTDTEPTSSTFSIDSTANSRTPKALDEVATKLGYTSWSDMVTEAVNNGKTIIQGGYLNTSLIQARSIAASQLAIADFSSVTDESGNGAKLSGWVLNSDEISSLGGEVTINSSARRVKVTNGSGYIQMYHTSNSDWGLIGHDGSQTVFQLGSTNKIAGWLFDGSKIHNNDIELLSSGAIRHVGGSWELRSDGSGFLAAGNVSWDTLGNLQLSGNINALAGSIGGWSISEDRISGGAIALLGEGRVILTRPQQDLVTVVEVKDSKDNILSNYTPLVDTTDFETPPYSYVYEGSSDQWIGLGEWSDYRTVASNTSVGVGRNFNDSYYTNSFNILSATSQYRVYYTDGSGYTYLHLRLTIEVEVVLTYYSNAPYGLTFTLHYDTPNNSITWDVPNTNNQEQTITLTGQLNTIAFAGPRFSFYLNATSGSLNILELKYRMRVPPPEFIGLPGDTATENNGIYTVNITTGKLMLPLDQFSGGSYNGTTLTLVNNSATIRLYDVFGFYPRAAYLVLKGSFSEFDAQEYDYVMVQLFSPYSVYRWYGEFLDANHELNHKNDANPPTVIYRAGSYRYIVPLPNTDINEIRISTSDEFVIEEAYLLSGFNTHGVTGLSFELHSGQVYLPAPDISLTESGTYTIYRLDPNYRVASPMFLAFDTPGTHQIGRIQMHSISGTGTTSTNGGPLVFSPIAPAQLRIKRETSHSGFYTAVDSYIARNVIPLDTPVGVWTDLTLSTEGSEEYYIIGTTKVDRWSQQMTHTRPSTSLTILPDTTSSALLNLEEHDISVAGSVTGSAIPYDGTYITMASGSFSLSEGTWTIYGVATSRVDPTPYYYYVSNSSLKFRWTISNAATSEVVMAKEFTLAPKAARQTVTSSSMPLIFRLETQEPTTYNVTCEVTFEGNRYLDPSYYIDKITDVSVQLSNARAGNPSFIDVDGIMFSSASSVFGMHALWDGVMWATKDMRSRWSMGPSYYNDIPSLVIKVNERLSGLFSLPATGVNTIDFTGQHYCHPDESLAQEIEAAYQAWLDAGADPDVDWFEPWRGKVVVVTGEIRNFDGAIKARVSEAIPTVRLADEELDTRVFGVIADHEWGKPHRTFSLGLLTTIVEKDANRILVNSLGEGGIWVCDINGPIQAGDLLTTCVVPGYAARQPDNVVRSYTIAKATQSCDFSADNNTYDTTTLTEIEIEEPDGTTRTVKAAFIGCVYLC